MNTKTLNNQKHAFTLIEVLVVIAIIGILAGLIFPMIGKSVNTAKRNRAVADANSIAAGIQLFYAEYGYMPIVASSQGSGASDGPAFGDEESKSIIEVLVGDNTNINPKGISYLDADFPIVNGEFPDPWGNQFWIKMDLNFDNKISIEAGSVPHTKRAIVISRGKNGELESSSDGDDVANVSLEQ